MAFQHDAKTFVKKHILIYILLTILPAAGISYILSQHHVKMMNTEEKIEAQKIANTYAMNIENFLGETVGRLEMLATSIKVQKNDLSELKKILTETAGKDTRFSGFYWANTDGDVLIGTNPINNPVNVGKRPYFQHTVKTKKTSFSKPHIGSIMGRYIISISTPIVEQGRVKGVLIASLRLDEMEAKIKNQIKGETVLVVDNTGQTLFKTGQIPKDNTVISRTSVAQLPWTITAFKNFNTADDYRRTFLKYLFILLTVFNILYLLIKYILLRRNLKKEQEQTEIHKLELIGKLAASTAHEIRNPLTGIKGLVKLLSEEYRDEKAHSYFEVIQTEIDRINSIVSELLVLGKPTAYHLKTYDANHITAEINPIIQSEANFTNIELITSYSSESLFVSCVKDQLKQVILNLTKNSLQAMPNGGSLYIFLERKNNLCSIRVKDNGSGMSAEQIAQAFNPFYTLKKDGSGLGLTVCKRIIESYGGDINLTSTLNKGTEVEITIPLALEINNQ
ncbi:PAS domain-containing sensor histidine kinase [Neobacillus mesonae]|uniref:PAS domain-containing sensor histidine kinase n=1 Tax=Neobacillus mesonae TaxID=1193713 RepID=UPI00082AA294|nr:PAS domain-containing sensor histidine kinase [Neobacillus mesonae]